MNCEPFFSYVNLFFLYGLEAVLKKVSVKILTVLVIHKNRRLFDSTNDDVMNGARGIDAGLAWHQFRLPGQ